jgi:hypothetical protein
MSLDRDKLASLDTQVAVISERLRVIESNHLAHIEADVASIKKIIWRVGFLVFSNLLAVLLTLLYRLI